MNCLPQPDCTSASSPLPTHVGIGLKPRHYQELLRDVPRLAFLEVHTENCMGEGGPPHRYLEALAARYPLSFHGVGLSLGSAGGIDHAHLSRWRRLIDRYEPALVSEHIAWSAHGGIFLHDLLPLPYTEESLVILCTNIDDMQTSLGRSILVENSSAYLTLNQSAIPEVEFIAEVTGRTGCGLLLDINNVWVSACNNGFDARRWLACIPGDIVGEIHLAGHAITAVDGHELRIDDHGSRVSSEVWKLYDETVARIGPRPTLIEWDTNVPSLGDLLAEASRAGAVAGHREPVDARPQ